MSFKEIILEEYNTLTIVGKCTWFPVFVVAMLVAMPMLMLSFVVFLVTIKFVEKPMEILHKVTKHVLYKSKE